MKYIVECACASTETITYTDRAGTNYSWTGVLDLAPTWCNPAATTNIAATTAEQEWVSACLLTVINRRGGDVGGLQISVATANSERPKLAVSGSGSTQGEYFTYLSGYSAPFITYPPSVQYYGNIFGDSTGQKGRYVAPMAEGVAGPHLDWPELGRDCSIDGCGAMTVPGFSSKNMAFATPDIHGHTMPQKANICSWAVGNANIATSCLDDTGRTWTRVITETNPSVSNLTCVSGSCTNVTSGTADGLGATAIGANYVTLGSTGRTEIQRMVGGGLNQYTTKVVFRTRYRSSAAATLKLSALDCYTYAQEWSLGTFTFPSTGDQWAWMNITITWPTYFDWTTTTNPVHIVWSGADTSSPNAKLDASLIALP